MLTFLLWFGYYIYLSLQTCIRDFCYKTLHLRMLMLIIKRSGPKDYPLSFLLAIVNYV